MMEKHDELVAATEAQVQETQKNELASLFRSEALEEPEGEEEVLDEEETLLETGEEASESGEEDTSGGEGETAEETPPEASEEVASPELAALREQIAVLQTQLAAITNQPPKEEEPETPPEVKVETPALNMVTEEEYDEALRSVEGFNALLNRAAARIAEFTIRNQVGYLTKTVDERVDNRVLVNEFYKTNPDLRGHRAAVGTTFKLIQSSNPGLSTSEVLEKLAPMVRTIQGLPAPNASTPPPSPDPKPKPKPNQFGPGGGSRRVKPKELKGLGAEISAMENV
jgi:hypothetical protein